MNYTYLNDIVGSKAYIDFMDNNKGIGKLKIRSYAASEALPVSGLNILVSTIIDGKRVLFFEGKTDTSGVVNTISLPAPIVNLNNLEVPTPTKYEIEAYFDKGVDERIFNINMYDGICVLQNINYSPGGEYGN